MLMKGMKAKAGPIDYFARWGGSLINFFYPPVCLICQRGLIFEENNVCQVCIGEIMARWEWQCDKCGAVGAGREPEPYKRCRLCPSPEKEYEGVLSTVNYRGAAARCVYQFKYIHRAQMGILMGKVIREKLAPIVRPIAPRIDRVTPVPLYWLRRLQRGFNQNDMLARELAKSLKLLYDRNLLKRIRHTGSQARTPEEHRFRNVAGAFRVRGRPDLSDSGILLVDDVLTSGSTVQECAAVLKQAGAREVWIATFARAGLVHGSEITPSH